MEWKIGAAKQNFSQVVQKSARQIQWILNRDERVAAVISADEAAAFVAWREQQRTVPLGVRLTQLSEACEASDYELDIGKRTDRAVDLYFSK